MPGEFNVTRDQLGQFYLSYPVPLEDKLLPKQQGIIRDENQVPPIPLVAIDPGMCTFATTFDSDGNIHEFGVDSLKQCILPLCSVLDRLQSHWSQQPEGVKSKKHYQLGKATVWI